MPNELTFSQSRHTSVRPGMAIRLGSGEDRRLLRITHVFSEELYGMWVTTAENCRFAVRPFLIPWERYDKWMRAPGSQLGKLSLPTTLTRCICDEDRIGLEARWLLIEPLVSLFEHRDNLQRNNFSALIRDYAESVERHFNSVLRPLLRFYYFGADRRGLLVLPSGAAQNTPVAGSDSKRRGRQSIALSAIYGSNEFVVSEEDIADMAEALAAKLKEGPCFLPEAHEHYLQKWFSKRHPKDYRRFLCGEIQMPVTERQFKYYLPRNELRIDKDLLENKKGAQRPSGNPGVLRAFGPGSASEIDATGGRVVLVAKHGSQTIELGTPWIYLVIDRWSRYVLAIYITLRSPAYAEVKHALLAMVTTRERYRLIGCNVTDEEWPSGSVPAALVCDRGAEFLSEAFEQDVVERLLIQLQILPPLVPDGKAIVERAIGTLKRRVSSRLKRKGAYVERPVSSPKASKAFRTARKQAVCSFAELYRVLIEVVCDYNNRPHKTLKQYPELAAHGIKPTPRDAYLYGRMAISGTDVGSMSEEDFVNLLLDQREAEGVDQRLRYRGDMYEPRNSLARKLATSWRKKPVPLQCSVDELAREIRVWSRSGWATFDLRRGNLAQAGAFTPEEQEKLRALSGAAAVVCGHDELVKRLKKSGVSAKAVPRLRTPGRNEKIALRRAVTDATNRSLRGHQPSHRPKVAAALRADVVARAAALDSDQLDDQLAAIRRHRGMK